MIDPVAAVGSVGSATTPLIPESSAPGAQRAFDLAEKMVSDVNSTVGAADAQVRGLVLGQAGSLHDVMIALESARVSMGMLVQVRNRVVDAYQDLMRMQI